jgi:uncharacterized protein YdeI (BOF family)
MQTGIAIVLAALAGAASGAAQAAGENPYAAENNTWISLSGQVEAVQPDRFQLDYGDGIVAVEMDDGDRDADAYKLMPGDRVTVNGRVDDDFFEKTTIEAGSVYVENIGTYFFASSVDEEDSFVSVSTPVIVSTAVVQGEVTAVGEDTFVIDSGPRNITIAVDELGYDPLDDEGYQRIDIGDRVSVTGTIEGDLREGRMVQARSVLTLAGR